MLAACYLPRQWPAKYFRLCRALRPCSGWVRVVYLRLATNKLFVCLVSFIQDSSLYAEDCIRYSFHQLLALSRILCLGNLRLLRSFRFRFTHNGTDKMFRPQFAGSPPPNSDFTPSYGIRKSPRPISISRLKMLPLLHL